MNKVDNYVTYSHLYASIFMVARKKIETAVALTAKLASPTSDIHPNFHTPHSALLPFFPYPNGLLQHNY